MNIMATKHIKPEKFLQAYTCECFQPHNYCNCPHKIVSSESYVESVQCAVESIAEVMAICGIPEYIAQNSKSVVIYYFLHFQEKRHRIDTVPRKHIYRLDLMNDLARKCDMTFTQAQISYSIIKRVFRAFYHGTDEGGVPNPLLERQLKHSAACLWYHAARRTAQVVASYQGMFTVVQKNIELEIRHIYRKLYDHVKNIMPAPDADHECTCQKCYKRMLVESLPDSRHITEVNSKNEPYEALYQRENNRIEEAKLRGSHLSARHKRKSSIVPIKCNCRSLRKHKDEYDIPSLAESTNTGYSQGPFICYWYPITEESDKEDDAEIDILQKLPTEVPCPPCVEEQSGDSPCSSCSCTCETCTCSSERSCDTEGDTISVIEALEEEEGELSEETMNLDLNKTTKHTCCPHSVGVENMPDIKEPKMIQKPKSRRTLHKKEETISPPRLQTFYSQRPPQKIRSPAQRENSRSIHSQVYHKKNAYAIKLKMPQENSLTLSKGSSIGKEHRETMTELFEEHK